RKLVRSVALGADKQLDAAWVAEGQMQRRFEDNPVITSGVQEMLSGRVDESRLALHWQPGNQALNVTLAYDDEFLHNDQASNPLDSVMRQHLRSQQLGLRWLAGSQWTANLNWSRNQFSATQQSVAFDALLNPVPVLLVVRERFTQTDASLDWQFSRAGSLDIGVRNAGGRSFGYTEIDPLVPRFSKGRMNYARLKLAW
ncbi:MAG: TonB-dependent receptor, partial [Gallionella sp.]|nr:TonB-dependent receptor [Gallionella sp.]